MASYNGNWHVEVLGRPVRDQLDRHRRSAECVETPASVTTTITTASADDVTRHFAHAIAAIRNRRACGRAGSAGLQLQYKPTSAAASPTHYRRSSSRNQNHQQSPPRHRAVDRESGEIFCAQDNRITLYARAHRDRQWDGTGWRYVGYIELGLVEISSRTERGDVDGQLGWAAAAAAAGGRVAVRHLETPLPSTPRTTPPAIMNTWPLLPTCARRRRTAIR